MVPSFQADRHNGNTGQLNLFSFNLTDGKRMQAGTVETDPPDGSIRENGRRTLLVLNRFFLIGCNLPYIPAGTSGLNVYAVCPFFLYADSPSQRTAFIKIACFLYRSF
ncbi:MAG TPA: hypothetical protein H9972_07920 [Candidatus Paraprevotella stercorigallinarum]|nr:hypothetical protein [Candidatus Paraprevotella stercorigallinarum]